MESLSLAIARIFERIEIVKNTLRRYSKEQLINMLAEYIVANENMQMKIKQLKQREEIYQALIGRLLKPFETKILEYGDIYLNHIVAYLEHKYVEKLAEEKIELDYIKDLVRKFAPKVLLTILELNLAYKRAVSYDEILKHMRRKYGVKIERYAETITRTVRYLREWGLLYKVGRDMFFIAIDKLREHPIWKEIEKEAEIMIKELVGSLDKLGLSKYMKKC